ncbi:MAG: TRAP transporter large permease [Deltaproteobacteria bacterium]|nr:TRAP transporter large permease [Deltaproteobacteria bacterium]
MVILLIAGLFSFMLTGLPIAVAMLIVGGIYIVWQDLPLMLVAQFMTEGAMMYVLIAIPLYLFAAALMNEVGMSHRIIRLCNAVIGHFRGGLALVNVLASMVFAGMSGEAIADTAGMGTILIPAMKKEGYDLDFSAAVTVSSAVIGPIIPPSVPMIICAALASTSVGRMFLGGMIPGILFGLLLMALSYALSVRRKYPVHPKATRGELWAAFKGSFLGLLTILIILGGIFGGIFTPIEAAGIAVVYSFLVGWLVYRSLNLGKLPSIALGVAVNTGIIMFIIALAKFYNFILTREQIPQTVIAFLMGLSNDPVVILFIITLGLFVLGCFLSTTPALMLVVPVLLPLVSEASYDLVHFFVVVTLALLLGTLTPPVGINLYLVQTISGVPTLRLLKELLPFYGVLIVVIFLALFFPWIVLAPGKLVFG